jgi:hypothetical protein
MAAIRTGSIPATYFDHAATRWRCAAAGVEAAIRCRRCKRSMRRLDCGWTCLSCPPAGSRITDDQVVLAVIAAARGHRTTPHGTSDMAVADARGGLRFLVRRSKIMQRMGVDQIDEPAAVRWPLTPEQKREANAAKRAAAIRADAREVLAGGLATTTQLAFLLGRTSAAVEAALTGCEEFVKDGGGWRLALQGVIPGPVIPGPVGRKRGKVKA